MGRERSRTETKTVASTTTTSTTSNAYDALGRLSSSVKTAGATTVFNQQFAYDPLGNLLSQTDTASGAINTTLTYLGAGHDRDRICHIAYGTDSNTACNVTYDDVGAITSMPTPTGVRTFDYLIGGSVKTIQDDHFKADFRYDAFGAVQELDLDVKAGTAPVGTDTRHDRHYGVFTRHDETTGPVLLRKISGPNGFLATRHGPSGKWVFTFGEQRGTRFQTDDGGNFVQDVNYQPFGKPASTGTASQPGSSLYSNEQWNGGDYLAAFGISQLGARLYDPATGRFLSRDPLLIPRTAATTNPYAFAANDPVNRSDPTGLLYSVDGESEEENDGGSSVGGSSGSADPPSPIAVNGETIFIDGGTWVDGNGIHLAIGALPIDFHAAAVEAAMLLTQPSVVETFSPGTINANTVFVKDTSSSRLVWNPHWEDPPPPYSPANEGSDPYGAEYTDALKWGPLGILKMMYSDNAPTSIKVLRWGIDAASLAFGAASLVRAGGGLVAAGTLEAAEGVTAGTLEAAEGAARTFTSADPLVGQLATKIEAMYPGHVVGVNSPLVGASGELLTDADILLQNAVIQVKSGKSAQGLLLQLQKSEGATGLPSIGFGPNLPPGSLRALSAQGGLVTSDEAVLLEVIRP
jgi:RHS repeat-associated protein